MTKCLNFDPTNFTKINNGMLAKKTLTKASVMGRKNMLLSLC